MTVRFCNSVITCLRSNDCDGAANTKPVIGIGFGITAAKRDILSVTITSSGRLTRSRTWIYGFGGHHTIHCTMSPLHFS